MLLDVRPIRELIAMSNDSKRMFDTAFALIYCLLARSSIADLVRLAHRRIAEQEARYRTELVASRHI